MKDNNFNFNQVFLNTLDSLTPYKSSIKYTSGGTPKGYASEQLLSFLHLNNISANISEKSLSILLAKASFAFLLISMLSYWFQMSFKSQIVMNNEVIVSTNNEVLNPLQVAEPTRYTLPLGYPDKSSGELQHCASTPTQRTLNQTFSMRVGYPKGVCTATCKKSTWAIILEKIPVISMWSANITLALLLSIRWIESGHFPLSNLYESLIFLSWSLTVIHLFLENLFYKNSLRERILCSPATMFTPEGVCKAPSLLGTPSSALELLAQLRSPQRNNEGMPTRYTLPSGLARDMYASDPTLTLGAITSPVVLFTNAFATFSLPQEMQKVTVLVPALKSNWLIMHVSVMIISYAALLSGSLLAMAFLVIKFIDELRSNCGNELRRNKEVIEKARLAGGQQGSATSQLFSYTRGYEDFTSLREAEMNNEVIVSTNNEVLNPLQVAEPTQTPSGLKLTKNKMLMGLPQILDNLSYRSIGLGFALLTIGILSGAVWANEAWGSYWSWDPKETWALITWLVFALYLHTRLSKGWVGKESAFVASFGFIVIWFCYLGVNLFGKGLHSYGWFQQ